MSRGKRTSDLGVDTVANAKATPEQPQPYAELGMAEDEYARVRAILGRRPTSAELAIYSVMWSEHCSYKSSKVHLRQFGDKAPPTDVLLVGMGENAGVVDAGEGWAVTFRSSRTTTPPTSSRTRAQPPVSAGSFATSSPWARVRWR
jgi:hypothetical protein